MKTRLMLKSVSISFVIRLLYLYGLWMGVFSTVMAQTEDEQNTFDCAAVSEIPQIECEALVAIYHSTDGPNWTFIEMNRWLVEPNPCLWNGVLCSDGHVSKLIFLDGSNAHLGMVPIGFGLKGALPSEIGHLSYVTELDFSDNQLRSLPPEIGNLSSLTSLALTENQLSSLPPEIGNLSNLAFLNIAGNLLNSLPPEIGNLSNLLWLHAVSNQLSSLPGEIGNLGRLSHLVLYNNDLHSLPTEIGQLSNLVSLGLGRNQLSSLPASIGNLEISLSSSTSYSGGSL